MHIRWRGLELPNSLVCDRESLTSTYGKFTAEPFERGFGTSNTLACALSPYQPAPPRPTQPRSMRSRRSSRGC